MKGLSEPPLCALEHNVHLCEAALRLGRRPLAASPRRRARMDGWMHACHLAQSALRGNGPPL